jgi:hypothetical protein
VVRLRGVDIPSGEYACIQNGGFGVFTGPTDAASIQALLSWKINVVRLPLNEDCWLGVNTAGLDPAYVGANYRNTVVDYVTRLTQAGIAVIVDLHWAAPGLQQAVDQRPMADRDHSPAFWTSVATAFKSNTAVIFDLFNEPYPDDNQDTTAAWTCLRDGSSPGVPTAVCPGKDEQHNDTNNYAAAGTQELLNAVRATGATNLVLVAGIAYTGVLRLWLTYKPNDPLNNIAASMHIYPPGSQCSNQACWDTDVAPVVAQYPLIAGEIGQDSCGVDRINPVIDWLEGKGQHYLAWAWWTEPCGTQPYYGLITDANTGAPSAGYGQGYHDRLAALVVASAPTSTPTVTTVVGASTPTPTPTSPVGGGSTPTATLVALLGDINGDGIVDIRDYGMWRQGFGQTNCGNVADLNADCIVDIRDYGVWRTNFGHIAGAAGPGAAPAVAPRSGTATPTPTPSRTPTRR